MVPTKRSFPPTPLPRLPWQPPVCSLLRGVTVLEIHQRTPTGPFVPDYPHLAYRFLRFVPWRHAVARGRSLLPKAFCSMADGQPGGFMAAPAHRVGHAVQSSPRALPASVELGCEWGGQTSSRVVCPLCSWLMSLSSGPFGGDSRCGMWGLVRSFTSTVLPRGRLFQTTVASMLFKYKSNPCAVILVMIRKNSLQENEMKISPKPR